MTGPRRNDPHHFPSVNGRGHRRRKVINQHPGLDRYEQRTQEVITSVFAEFDAILTADAERRARAEIAHLEGWFRGGEPGE